MLLLSHITTVIFDYDNERVTKNVNGDQTLLDELAEKMRQVCDELMCIRAWDFFIKTYLRSNIMQEPLSGLAILSTTCGLKSVVKWWCRCFCHESKALAGKAVASAWKMVVFPTQKPCFVLFIYYYELILFICWKCMSRRLCL